MPAAIKMRDNPPIAVCTQRRRQQRQQRRQLRARRREPECWRSSCKRQALLGICPWLPSPLTVLLASALPHSLRPGEYLKILGILECLYRAQDNASAT